MACMVEEELLCIDTQLQMQARVGETLLKAVGAKETRRVDVLDPFEAHLFIQFMHNTLILTADAYVGEISSQH